jgi:hypothetical protein
MVVFEDAVAHDLAMEVCGEVMNRLETELAFTFSFWKLNDLNDPASAGNAAEAVAAADILLFSLPGHELVSEAMNWLEVCAPARTKREGALALIIAGRPGPALAVEALVFQMHFAAHRLRMDFLPLLSPSPGQGPEFSAELPAVRPDTLREGNGGNHWGLNE